MIIDEEAMRARAVAWLREQRLIVSEHSERVTSLTELLAREVEIAWGPIKVRLDAEQAEYLASDYHKLLAAVWKAWASGRSDAEKLQLIGEALPPIMASDGAAVAIAGTRGAY